MAKQPRQVRAAEKPSRVLTFVQFGDLHVSRATVERCCRVLRRVGELARDRAADAVVCTGDFWDLRGSLDVRLVELVLAEIERIGPLVLVPGNHDQVTLDGRIHGLNVFRGRPNVTVATDPIFDRQNKIAFLPWREIPAEQCALFDTSMLPERSGWTVFAHAEVEGAVSNTGRRTRGHVPLAVIEQMARACYMSHYHLRQRLGERTWYVGSPFELTVAERGQPHGVAVIRTDRVEPEFVELQGFPRHYRVSLEAVEAGELPRDITSQDVVELEAPAQEIGSERYDAAVRALVAEDVRPRPAVDEAAAQAPSFSLSLEAAMERYVNEALGLGSLPVPEEIALTYGRALLAEVPEARRAPPLGRQVQVRSLYVRDFCALSGETQLEFPEGRVLLMGPVRQGKTAVLDAIMWALYGVTTPRKAGASAQAATLRADDVVHDAAKDCEVRAVLDVDGRKITITRSKRRGQGAKVSIVGLLESEGIAAADQQRLCERVIGLSHPLWRACVSLGQGAVSTFATDADKARKAMLASLFGLESCPGAQKLARERVAEAEERLEVILQKLVDAGARVEMLAQSDLVSQAERWEQERQQKLQSLKTLGTDLAAKIQQSDALLEGEAQWLQSRAAHELRVRQLEKQLGELRPQAKLAQLQREYGGLEREQQGAERTLVLARARFTRLVETGAASCEACGQPLPETQREQHLQSAETEVQNAQRGLDTFAHQLSNVAAQLDALNSGGAAQYQALQQELEEGRAVLKKCDDALGQFARVRQNRDLVAHQIEDARADYRVVAAQQSPFEERAKREQEQLRGLRDKIAALEAETRDLTAAVAIAEFWVDAFGARGLPALVLRTALYDLESSANRYLSRLLGGTLFVQLAMDDDGDDLRVGYIELCPDGERRERSYEQLSGGQRRCAELAFAPFALGDLVRARAGVNVSFLALDELTTHLGQSEKEAACQLLAEFDRRTVIVVDHDPSVQGHFDVRWQLERHDRVVSVRQV